MNEPTDEIRTMARRLASGAKEAARVLAALDGEARTAALLAMADRLESSRVRILEANARDVEEGKRRGLPKAMVDRLLLTPERFDGMVEGVRTVAALPDPVGRLLDEKVREDGLRIRKVSVPIGVALIIFESRPNVAADAAALCVKSGNAVILRGGSEAFASVRAIGDALGEALAESPAPAAAVQVVPTTDRAAVRELLAADEWIDVVIPRGGESLIRAVSESARMPVLKHYAGVCHVYVDRAADPEMAERIVVNAKCQRPGVCNAMETLLIHREIAPSLLPGLAKRLAEEGVELRADEAARAWAPGAKPAAPDDFGREFLDLILAVAVVNDVGDAIDFIARHGSGHSDAIVTEDAEAAERFLREVDSAAVYVNASTRFTDGGEFGMGAEMGISTGKLHARGPVGLEELTSYKYVIHGRGHVRT